MQIRQSYRKLAKKYHPDKHKDDEEAHKKFQEIAEGVRVCAADVMSQPTRCFRIRTSERYTTSTARKALIAKGKAVAGAALGAFSIVSR